MLLLSHPDVVMLLSLLLPIPTPKLSVLAGSVISQGCVDNTEFGAGLLNKFDGEGGGLGEDTRSGVEVNLKFVSAPSSYF